jgi:ABC-type amino acid transport substrate-binding protein
MDRSKDRLRVFVALLLVAMLALAACGGGAEDGDDTGSASGSDTGGGITSVDELPDGARVGVQSGTTGAFYAQENLTNVELVEFEKAPEMYQQLQAGQLDAVFNDLPVSLDAVKNATGLEVVQQIETGEEYAIAVAKDNPALKEALNAALQSMFEDGSFAEIYQKYFPEQELPSYAQEGDGGTGDVSIDLGDAKLVEEGRLTVGSDIPYPPFEMEEGGELTGYDVEIVRELAARMGLENEDEDWISTDFGTIFQQLQSGTKFDIVVAAVTGYAAEGSPAEETVQDRLELVDFTEPYYPSLQSLTINTATSE